MGVTLFRPFLLNAIPSGLRPVFTMCRLLYFEASYFEKDWHILFVKFFIKEP